MLPIVPSFKMPVQAQTLVPFPTGIEATAEPDVTSGSDRSPDIDGVDRLLQPAESLLEQEMLNLTQTNKYHGRIAPAFWI